MLAASAGSGDDSRMPAVLEWFRDQVGGISFGMSVAAIFGFLTWAFRERREAQKLELDRNKDAREGHAAAIANWRHASEAADRERDIVKRNLGETFAKLKEAQNDANFFQEAYGSECEARTALEETVTNNVRDLFLKWGQVHLTSAIVFQRARDLIEAHEGDLNSDIAEALKDVCEVLDVPVHDVRAATEATQSPSPELIEATTIGLLLQSLRNRVRAREMDHVLNTILPGEVMHFLRENPGLSFRESFDPVRRIMRDDEKRVFHDYPHLLGEWKGLDDEPTEPEHASADE
jgi:hypothetical protein